MRASRFSSLIKLLSARCSSLLTRLQNFQFKTFSYSSWNPFESQVLHMLQNSHNQSSSNLQHVTNTHAARPELLHATEHTTLLLLTGGELEAQHVRLARQSGNRRESSETSSLGLRSTAGKRGSLHRTHKWCEHAPHSATRVIRAFEGKAQEASKTACQALKRMLQTGRATASEHKRAGWAKNY